ncbi:MAG: hypothetical protein IJY90_02170 [Clostridia bacterium]|nr:hypothetical protein [Clostridia bacterium]
MKKAKRIFKGLLIALSFFGIIGGSVVSTNIQNQANEISSADFASYDKVQNDLPDYLTVNKKHGAEISSIFLINASTPSIDLDIAWQGQEIEYVGTGTTYTGKKNPAYFTQAVAAGDNPTEYYYFNFTSSLSLYKDVSNVQYEEGMVGTNLLDGAKSEIDNYTEVGEFPSKDEAGFFPEKFKATFSLNTSLSDIDVTGRTITLNEEGLYTIVIPTLVYYTDNAGETFTLLEEKEICCTFMIFNSTTYFKSSGVQNVNFSDNLEHASLISSQSYSTYHFYNYSDATNVNALPTLTYDYRNFEISVKHTDADDNTSYYYIEYRDGQIVIVDSQGDLITNKISIDARLSNGAAKITFVDIGGYDVNFNYLYVSQNDTTTTTYQLPLAENITDETLQNKAQKVFIYGYQALHSNYDVKDEQTNQPTESELKSFDFNLSAYTDTADITSLVNKHNSITSPHTSATTGFDLTGSTGLKNKIEAYLSTSNNDRKEPVSTNQPPVKFITNAALSENSYYYPVTVSDVDEDGIKEYTLGTGVNFTGFNQNIAGTYVYIIQYQFGDYLSQSGISQAGFYHYQIFFFTITNTTPVVTVYSADECERTEAYPFTYKNFNELYTRGYTNKSVFVINEADTNEFDAEVDIRISAYNYLTGTYFFEDQPIKDLSSVDGDLIYEAREFKFDGEDNAATTKQGILIKNTEEYANAKFTITINSSLTEVPTVQTFTIDTFGISNVHANNVNQTISTTYTISDEVGANATTNRPIIFGWDKKASGAKTYGYLKYIPLAEKNDVYPSDKNAQSNVIFDLLDSYNMLPVSYMLNFDKSSSWSEYKNTNDFTSNIPGTYVKSDSGLYILQVYDQAGNYTFEVFMIDKTAPVFVKATVGDTETYEVITNSAIISIPQDQADIFIQWGKFKGVYIGETLQLADYKGYELSGIKQLSDASFEDAYNTFLSNKTKTISGFSRLSTLNGYYFAAEINDTFYVKPQKHSTYSSQLSTDYKYQVSLFTTINGNKEANDGNCKIILRDSSNNYNFSDQFYSYLNYPSAYLSFNVSSDLAQFNIYYDNGALEDEPIEGEQYSNVAPIYKTPTGEFTTDSDDGNGNNYDNSGYRKKFSYLPALNTTKPLYASYIPLTSSGAQLEEVKLNYYPYEAATDTTTTPGTYYHYYTIAKDATISLTLFKFDVHTAYTEDEKQQYPLSLGQTDEPLAGKYVFTRTYRTTIDANTLAKASDFFSRQFTFYVDTNGIISPLTEVNDGGSNTALENLIGGDIVINAHSGDGNSSIHISFPRYNENGLNSGSFYTQTSYSTNQPDEYAKTVTFNSNKLPLALYIPKYKYTVASIYNDATNDFNLKINNLLSFFGNELTISNTAPYSVMHDGIVVEEGLSEDALLEYLSNTLSMNEYELSAEITYSNDGETKYYSTKSIHENNRLHYETTNDYLTFYERPQGLTAEGYGNAVENFTKPGLYYVTIYQCANDPQSNMYKCYKLAFRITENAPNFDVKNEDGYILEQAEINNEGIFEGEMEIYYTNSDSLTIEWSDPKNIYMAKVDRAKIEIKDGYTNDISYAIDILPEKSYKIELTDLIEDYYQTGFITISFQFEGHSDEYYSKTVKKIHFDIHAFEDNLNKMMENVATSTNDTFSVEMQKKSMRVYTDYTGASFDPTVSSTEASYITSVDNGVFKYYAFTISSEFFTQMRTDLIEGKYSLSQVNEVYYREIVYDTYIQSSKSDYLNSFSRLSISNDMTEGNCYEIIETDWAGNRTTYIVYITDTAQTTAIKYTAGGQDKEVEQANLQSAYNIYATPEFAIDELSYNQDPWLYFTFTRNNKGARTTSTYFKSPFLTDGQVYKITYSNGLASYSQEKLAEVTNVTESSQNKHTLAIADQILGETKTCYITVLDSALIMSKDNINTEDDKAKILINVPTLEQVESTTKGYVFPQNIKISVFDSGWIELTEINQTTYGVWEPLSKIVEVYNTSSANALGISVTAGSNKKVKFVVTDNFGKEQTIIILTGQAPEYTVTGEYYTVEDADYTTYVSSKTLTYTYNTSVYGANVGNAEGINVTKNSTDGKVTLQSSGSVYFDGYVKIELYDATDANKEILKTIYLRICNRLPNVNKTETSVENAINDSKYGIIFLNKNRENIGQTPDGIKSDMEPNPKIMQFTKDGQTFRGPVNVVTTFSRYVTVMLPNGLYHSNSDTEIYKKALTYSVYLSRDGGLTWENIDGFKDDNSPVSYKISGVGLYHILIKYNDEQVLTNSFKLFELEICDSNSAYYQIKVDGHVQTKSSNHYVNANGKEYELTYIVALDYADSKNRLSIIRNEELDVKVTLANTIRKGTIVTEIYSYECDEAKGEFAIVYIPISNDIASSINYELASGQSVSLKDGNNAFVAADKNTAGKFNKLKVSFSSYYGIEINKIQPRVYKLINDTPVALDLTVYAADDNLSYVYLEMAGTYYLQILDSCSQANSQTFSGATLNGHEYVEIVFLPTVAFEVISKNADGEEVVTAPIQKAVYNSEVKLRLPRASYYYLASEPPTIVATKNGEALEMTSENNVYTFTEPGYYKVHFIAKSNTNVQLREEVYSFSIVNKNESRYAFEFSEHGNYYIESIYKNGKDVTEDLIKYGNFKTITVKNKVYLSSINLNHLDEKTGDGKYSITVNINNPDYAAVVGDSFTFSLWINLAKPPINVSISEGASTTKTIVISFNTTNLYNAVGDCYIQIGRLRKDYTAENIDSYNGTDSISISSSGTYYIQVYTQSGHLLYSYKVTKTAPLNTFAILAIVLGAIAAAVLIFITVKLRKRQKVK